MTKLTGLVYHAKFVLILIFTVASLNVCVVYIYAQEFSLPGVLTVAFLNVGQGDAILIQTPMRHTMLIDGGLVTSNLLTEIGRTLPFYKNSIDAVMASHPDADHIGGLIHVLQKYRVGSFIESGVNDTTDISSTLTKLVSQKNITAFIARRGMRITLDHEHSIYVDILFPDRDVSDWIADANAASIVARLVYGNSSFLFTGDSPKQIENFLMHSVTTTMLASDVLKVGHHGSRTSTADSFVQAVHPRYGVISAGKNNRYKHPHNEVVTTLKENNVQILRTDQRGTIIIQTNGTFFWVSSK